MSLPHVIHNPPCTPALYDVQLLYRRGKALSMKGDYDEADESLAAAAVADPSISADVAAARAANTARAKAATAKQRSQFRNFFAKAAA
jgi:hypothetical protein